MRFFDLHCDTLYRDLKENKGLYENNYHVAINRTQNLMPYVGCFAVWIPDNVRGLDAVNLFKRAVKRLKASEALHSDCFKVCDTCDTLENLGGKQGIILTVEGGAVLGGDLQRVRSLSDSGVKIMTLTWNGRCELGDGAQESESAGLSNFGKKAVQSLEKHGIIVDVSHASQKLFYDVCEMTKKPFIATHSNSAALCPHVRNLTDEQFDIIKSKGGLVGVTFCDQFLSVNSHASIYDVFNHIEYFLSRGGENTVAIGSDFDGSDMPEGIKGIECIENLYEYFLKKNYKEELVDKIFFKNAYNFMSNYM